MGELHAELGVGSAMMRIVISTPGATGVKGAGGICRGAGGRRQGLAAVPVGGGGAWPGFETTRRAKLAARTASGRAAAHGHTQQPGLTQHATPGTPVGPQATPAFTASQQHAEKSYEKYESFIGSS